MIGILANTGAVLIGSIIGLLFRKMIKKDIFDATLKAVGICVIIFGVIGVIKSMVIIDNNGSLISNNELLFIVCLSIGTLIGELLKIEKGINYLGEKVEKKLNKEGFSKGFVNATLIFCVGAMAIVGSVLAATKDYQTLYLKSIIDGITALILAASLGYGVIFSSISVLIYQGLIYLLALALGNFMTSDFINCFSMLGYAMVMCIGINFISNNKIKVANMLPSIILVILYFLIFK